MAARNTFNSDSRRFVYRPPDKDPEPYFVPVNRGGSLLSQPSEPQRPTVVRSADSVTPRADVSTPARRVVVIRNTKNPQLNQEPSDLNDLARSNPPEKVPIITNGNKSVFLVRRPIVPPDSSRNVEVHQPIEEPPAADTFEDLHTPTSPPEMTISPDPPRSPSPQRSSPPIDSKPVQHYAPYLRRSRSKVQTASSVPETFVRPLSPFNRKRVKTLKPRSPSPTKEEEQEVQQPQPQTHKRSFWSFLSRKKSPQPIKSPSPVIIENEQETTQYRTVSAVKTSPQKKTRNERTKSAKSVVFVHPDDQSIVVLENSFVKGEPIKPVIKRRKSSLKRTRFQVEKDSDSTEKLVQTTRSGRCLDCLTRCMCLIIVICLILLLIGLAGAAVSAYFLAINTSTNLIPTIIGLVIAGLFIIGSLCFLYIVLACIGLRDGYFSYNEEEAPHIGGRALAFIPPHHPNAHLYIPLEYMKIMANSRPLLSPVETNSNTIYNQAIPPLSRPPPSAISYSQQQTIHRTNTVTNAYGTKSTKNNITIEMDERLVSGRKISPKSHERNLNKVIKNVGQIVEDAKKRYHGDVPSKVIVRVDENETSTN